MIRQPSLPLAILLLLLLAARRADAEVPEGQLAMLFTHPPASARPSCFWWWFNSLVDKEGITRDLEEFKAKGMGGVTLICSGNDYGVAEMPRGPVFLSAEWRELYRHALQEAHRLGLEVGVNFCGGGWCMGGAWIKPEFSSRWFVQSQLGVTGPRKFSGPLPVPGYRDGYAPPYHGNVTHYLTWPKEKADYRDTAVTAFREPTGGSARLGSGRGAHLAAKSNRQDGSLFLPRQTVMDQTLAPWADLPGDQPVKPEEVVDLTSRLQPDGTLDWEVPAGRWTILRTGHVVIGCDVRCVLPEVGYVLEVDWLNPGAVDEMFANLGRILLAEAGPLAGSTLKFFHTDSFEDGFPNWTGQLLNQFKHYRGYDPAPYLPVLSGVLVGSAGISDRFLYDYRKTVADRMADGNYGHFAERSRLAGLEIQCEAGGPSWSGTVCMDALKNLGRCDRPMGEFWQDGGLTQDGQNLVGKQTAAAAHIYGRRTASAEAFTGGNHWHQSPGSNKPVADRAFCEGINRFVFHTMTCTRPQDGQPGYEYGAGTHFNPNVTWWRQASGPWLDYVNRCQALLQSGWFAADVLYYNGDWAPNLVIPRHVDPALGKGYDYDVCNAEVLLTRLSVKAGRLVLPDGLSYRLLVLPDTRRMPVEVLQKIRDLVKAGATVVGPKPESDPGLKNYPQCDAEVKKIAARVWGACDGQQVRQQAFGQGRIFWGKPLREILLADGVLPDFEHSGQGVFIDFIHRTTADGEVYFLAYRHARAEKVDGLFRVAGRQPELWDPVMGTQRDLPEFRQTEDGRTAIPLAFEPGGSMFVVFRERRPQPAAGSRNGARNFPELKPVQELAGPWTVQFDPQWFYPAAGLGGDQARGLLVFDQLEDWSRRPELAVQYFSGTAAYRKVFDWAPEAGKTHLAPRPPTSHPSSRLFLNLGTVKETAQVRLNGQDLGVVWCHPWRVEITGAIKPGGNTLEIEVVNLWPNRLAGDSKLPPDQRRTRTNVPTDPRKPLLASGLLGPVVIQASAPEAAQRE
jgi:hypothetical protein